MHPRHGQEGSAGFRQGIRSSLARKYSIFTALLLGWVAFIFFAYDLQRENIDIVKVLLLTFAVVVAAMGISKFTNRLLARPLKLLQEGISSVREGKLEPIRVCRTGDEVEYLGESLNAMIAALQESRGEIQKHQEMLEDRIRQRTEALEVATQKALLASRAKSEFLANMSHELRTPMSGVLGMIDIVMDEDLPPHQRENLEMAKGCANNLLALLNDILDLSKIEAGRMMLERIPFDVRAVVQDCVKALMPRCRQKGIVIQTLVSRSIPRQLMGDPLRLRQILTNLLSNAVKFTVAGSVKVRARMTHSSTGKAVLELEVIDTGMGIPKEKQASIFEEFTQADGSVTRKYGGTGLGLTITRRLVEMHHGSIEVESEVGKGSTFRVVLEMEPLEHPSEEPVAGNGQPSGLARKATARILVAEDNLVNQKVVTAILGKNGYSVEVAGNGRQALEMLGKGAFDLVLMDIQMPELDGIRTAQRIRQDPRWDNLPVIAMTAHAMNGDREKCLQAGMNGYLSKPVMPAHLLDVISKHLARKASGEGVVWPPPSGDGFAEAEEDQELESGMMLLFLQLAPERIRKLHAAAARMDAATLYAQAQKLHKAAERIPAPGVINCASRIRDVSLSEDYAMIQDHLLSLEHEIGLLHQRYRQPAFQGH